MIFFCAYFLLFARVTRASILVVLDPGHGGSDTGAIHRLGTQTVAEKDITLALARKAATALRARGIQAVLTRDHDFVVALDGRTAIANSAARHADTVLLSIHINSARDPYSSGIETYVFNATNNEASRRLSEIENGSHRVEPKGILNLILSDLSATANYAESVSLACDVQTQLVSGMSAAGNTLRDRGVRPGLFYVLMGARVPAVLIEAGFASNPHEFANLINPIYQERFARALADGIAKWRWIRGRPLALSGIRKKGLKLARTRSATSLCR